MLAAQLVSCYCRTFGGVVIADLLDGFSNNLLVVDVCMRGDLTRKQDHSGFSYGFCGGLKD